MCWVLIILEGTSFPKTHSQACGKKRNKCRNQKKTQLSHAQIYATRLVSDSLEKKKWADYKNANNGTKTINSKSVGHPIKLKCYTSFKMFFFFLIKKDWHRWKACTWTLEKMFNFFVGSNFWIYIDKAFLQVEMKFHM